MRAREPNIVRRHQRFTSRVSVEVSSRRGREQECVLRATGVGATGGIRSRVIPRESAQRICAESAPLPKWQGADWSFSHWRVGYPSGDGMAEVFAFIPSLLHIRGG